MAGRAVRGAAELGNLAKQLKSAEGQQAIAELRAALGSLAVKRPEIKPIDWDGWKKKLENPALVDKVKKIYDSYKPTPPSTSIAEDLKKLDLVFHAYVT